MSQGGGLGARKKSAINVSRNIWMALKERKKCKNYFFSQENVSKDISGRGTKKN